MPDVPPAHSASALARRLASQTVALRERLVALARSGSPALLGVEPGDSDAARADALAQVLVHGALQAAVLGEEVDAPDPALRAALAAEFAELEALVGELASDAPTDPRGEPWVYFYEDFLAAHDPETRRRAGAWYTPAPVVAAMVALVDAVLREHIGIRLGMAAPVVDLVDPAVGTGAFLLGAVDHVAARRGPGAAVDLARNLRGAELLPGPCSVARLRLAARARALDPGAHVTPRIERRDTLRVDVAPTAPGRVPVVLGNPPYRRVPADERGDEPLRDLLDTAREHTIFSHHASLYNLYVYFWRWAIARAFEAGDGPGVVAFVTASSWLTGPGFVGLRQLVRERCDAAWILDLGGDNKGPRPEENVFDIETPVAVVVLARCSAPRPGPAVTRYRRVCGTRDEKLAAMAALAASDAPLGGPWEAATTGPRDPLVPPAGGALWASFPALADLFPWQQPGCKVGRTWPIAPSPALLEARWRALVAAPVAARPDLFKTTGHGRNLFTEVEGHPRLADEPPGAPPPPIRRYGYRSFDTQWVLQDPRLAALERPSLWRSASARQVFLVAAMTKQVGPGPLMTASAWVPDLDCFRGSFGGKDVLPLFRDGAAAEPNVTRGLLDALGDALGRAPPRPEDLAAYVYALLSAPALQARFAAALETPGPRVPMTADPGLWAEAVALGAELLGLHTGRRAPPALAALRWLRPVQQPPETARDVAYHAGDRVLRVGDGEVGGVRPDVWAYAVSGMPVVKKWLGYRTRRGAGRAASSSSALDRIRPEAWDPAWSDALLDLLAVLTATLGRHPAQADLLERVLAGPLVGAGDLPRPTPDQRSAPERTRAPQRDPGAGGSDR